MLRHIKRLVILILILFLIALTHWTYVYLTNKDSGTNPSFFDFTKNDSTYHYGQAKYFVKNFYSIVETAIQNDDKVKRGQLNAVGQALEMYQAENEKYPDSISKLVGDYIEANTEIIKNPDFIYKVSADGHHYQMSIPLKNGGLYSVEK